MTSVDARAPSSGVVVTVSGTGTIRAPRTRDTLDDSWGVPDMERQVESIGRSIARIHAAIKYLRSVIAVSESQLDDAERGAKAARRILIAEHELALLQGELTALHTGDYETALSLRQQFERLQEIDGTRRPTR